MTDWAELAGMWATAGQPGTPLSSIETFAAWLDKHDDAVIEHFLASRQIVAAATTEAWTKLIHGEDHEALLRVRAEIDLAYAGGDISQTMHETLIARIDGRKTPAEIDADYE